MALATATKGSSTVAEFFTKMKGLANEMASTGKKLDDDEVVSYILMGVGEEFESVTSAVANRTDPISLPELQAQLVSHEQCREIRDGGSHSSVNSVEKGDRGGGRPSYSHGGRGGGGRGGFRRGRNSGRNGGCGGGHNNKNNFTNNTFLEGVICQICGREGHGVDRCYKYVSYPKKSASAATTSYGVDTNWYMDTGATDHITSELDQLTIRDRYNGNDHVHTTSGSGMKINHIGHSTLSFPNSNLHLHNILHVPQANKNLVSFNRITRDNNVFLEFHPDHFLVKEQGTKKTLLQGRCERGLYPL
jgi:histone deacetylase 1/2